MSAATDPTRARRLELEGLDDETIASAVVELEMVAEELERRACRYMEKGNPRPFDLERRRISVLRLRHQLMLAWQVSV